SSAGGARLQAEDWQADVGEGERNTELARRAGSLMANGRMAPDDALTMLLAWNEAHCKPPLSEGEVRQIVESIAAKEARKPKPADPDDQVAAAKEAVSDIDTRFENPVDLFAHPE